MRQLSSECKRHLEQALDADDPKEKDFHVRQVIQAAGMGDVAEDPPNMSKH